MLQLDLNSLADPNKHLLDLSDEYVVSLVV